MISQRTLFTICAVIALLISTTFSLKYSFYENIVTDRPIIGILAQPESIVPSSAYPNRQYIAASYVKFIESAGGRVVPLPWTAKRAEIEALLPQLNGLLLTGGDSEYSNVVSDYMDVAININTSGTYFPVWATCQGFQFAGIYFSKNSALLKKLEVYDKSLPIKVANDANKSNWWDNMPNDLKTIIANPEYAATMNFHHWGISIADFDKFLADQFHLVSTNVADSGELTDLTHVSTMEHKKYPIYAVQWHPEKTNFEFAVDDTGKSRHTTQHTIEAILVTQYCSNFFVHECRKNNNKFTNYKAEQAHLIYNYSPTRDTPGAFVSNYIFDQWY